MPLPRVGSGLLPCAIYQTRNSFDPENAYPNAECRYRIRCLGRGHAIHKRTNRYTGHAGGRDKGAPAVYGDTKTQTASVLGKIEPLLKGQGLGMGDVVMMLVYMVGDPANGGKLDFAAMNAAYSQFFGTNDQPNKPVHHRAGCGSGPLVEIEVIAVKSK
jgi:enamine deaminase RidA (YjgF/YER057c/UK114 family)